jgi:hypothetical protein
MNKALRFGLALGLVILAFVAMGLLGHNTSSRKALRKYLAELRAHGEKLSYAELTSGRVTNVNGSLSLLTNAIRKARMARFSPGNMEMMKYIGPGRARVLWREDSPRLRLSGSTALASWADFGAQMEGFTETTAEIREALRDPAPYFVAPTNLWQNRVPDFVALRLAAQWLGGATEADLQRGDLNTAAQDLEALVSFGRLNRDELTLISQMIRVAIGGMGIAVTWEALQAPGWTEPQLQWLQRRWEEVDFIDGVELAFLGERAFGMELWDATRSTGRHPNTRALRFDAFGINPSTRKTVAALVSDYVLIPAYRLTTINDDELFHLKAMQQALETLRALKRRQGWKNAKQGLDELSAQVNRASRSPERFRYWFSLMSIPNSSRAILNGVRVETERQMTVAALALKRYQLRNGKYPASLSDLVPEFIGSVPIDLMNGHPLSYRATQGGTFVLYSVGEDGQDDGGDANPVAGGRFGFWEGKDAVWPAAVSGP